MDSTSKNDSPNESTNRNVRPTLPPIQQLTNGQVFSHRIGNQSSSNTITSLNNSSSLPHQNNTQQQQQEQPQPSPLTEQSIPQSQQESQSQPLPSPTSSSSSSSGPTKQKLVKKYFCRICQQGFTRKHNMVSHELIHSSLKPHVCSECNLRFRRIHDLKRHEKLHTGEKPYVCSKCSRRFARPDALTRHQNSANACSGVALTLSQKNDRRVSNASESAATDNQPEQARPNYLNHSYSQPLNSPDRPPPANPQSISAPVTGQLIQSHQSNVPMPQHQHQHQPPPPPPPGPPGPPQPPYGQFGPYNYYPQYVPAYNQYPPQPYPPPPPPPSGFPVPQPQHLNANNMQAGPVPNSNFPPNQPFVPGEPNRGSITNLSPHSQPAQLPPQSIPPQIPFYPVKSIYPQQQQQFQPGENASGNGYPNQGQFVPPPPPQPGRTPDEGSRDSGGNYIPYAHYQQLYNYTQSLQDSLNQLNNRIHNLEKDSKGSQSPK
ncbi:hypothetical protein G210_3662 [Candida maltosa Xu316]|uniref:C2H2-type domain-containing protein n=1 Tax=Candida maltosa (strain Xu316) TaxID=1245528 RepID=M3JTD3_CANMX|nr:hypothetical protein G210_3662 [Candida maltosa Xu316]